MIRMIAGFLRDSVGNLVTSLGTLISGEDQTLNRLWGGWRGSYSYIPAGQATTVIKASAGVLHSITFWGAATATNTTTFYDNASGAGTIIALPAATAVTAPVTVVLDVAFTNGLTVITATANGCAMTVSYL